MSKNIDVIKVQTKRHLKDFINVPKSIYSHLEQYVPDLDSDVRSLFDPQKNPGMKFSVIQPFVAYQHEKPVGRIVGIVNNKANKCWGNKNVRFSMIGLKSISSIPASFRYSDSTWFTLKE